LKPKYKLPNYFTPNGDDFNDFFVIKYENILEEYISFEVKIYDRYQRLVYSGYIKGDKIWNGSNSVNSQDIKTDFYYYEVTPVEYYGTSYERRKDKLVGTIYLEKER
jgi:gliding motility-associated-like protein